MLTKGICIFGFDFFTFNREKGDDCAYWDSLVYSFDSFEFFSSQETWGKTTIDDGSFTKAIKASTLNIVFLIKYIF